MNKKNVARQSVTIDTQAMKVWDALINPEMIKKYFFGTEAVSDWKIGSPIFYRGVWEGKSYEDKGKILNIVPGKLLETLYWSAAFGLEDKPENYKKVTYELIPDKGKTKLVLTQDNNGTEEERERSEQNWKMVLNSLKELLEKSAS